MADRTVRVRLEAAVQGFTAAMAQAQASTRGFGSKFGRMARENQQMMRTMGTVALAAGGTILAGFGKAVGAAAEFESEMNRVGALTGATGESFDALSTQAQELGRTTMFSASEAAQGMGFLAQAGFDTNEIMEAMPSTLDLAAAGQLDLAQAADIASNVLTGYGKEASEIGEVNDVIAATATSANTSVEQMGQGMSMVAPIANASGLAFEEVAAAIGMLGDAGIQGTRAGTTLRQTLAALESPTGPAAAAIEELGLNTHDASGNLRSMSDIVGQLERAGMSAGEVMEIFGNRAGPGMAAMVEMGSDKLKEFTGELENSQGAAREMADRQMEGLKGAMTELSSATEGMAIAFGSVLTPALEGVADGANAAFTRLADMSDPARKAISWGGALTGVALTLGGAFLFMAPRIVATKDALGTLATDMPRAAGAARKMRRALSGIGIAAGTAVAAVAAINKWGDSVEASLRGAAAQVDDLSLAFRGLSETGDAPDSVADSLDGLADSLIRVADPSWTEGWIGGPDWLQGPGWRKATEEVENVDQALAGLVQGGNVEAANDAFDRFAAAAEKAGVPVDELRELLPEYAKALDGADLEHQEAAESASQFVEGVEDVDESTEEATATIDAYTEATQSMIGVHLDAAKAEIAFKDAIDKVSTAAEENGTKLDLNSKKGRANREAIIGAADAAIQHAGSLIEEGASAEDATAALEGHIGNLKEEMSQAGYTEAQISSLIDEYNLTPDQILTEIIAETGNAESKLARFRSQVNSLNGRRVTVFMDTQYGRTVAVPGGGRITERASGGPVSAGRPYLVGEEGPELVTFGQSGTVHDAQTSAQAMASSAPAPQVSVSAGGMPGSVTLVDVNGSILAQAEVIADGVARSHRAASARGRRMREGAV